VVDGSMARVAKMICFFMVFIYGISLTFHFNTQLLIVPKSRD
jgi:hypothetical protein